VSDREISAKDALLIIAGLIGVVLLLVGFGNMSTANLSDPIDGAKQWLEGVLQAGIGVSLILAAIGAVEVIAAVLSFILSVIRRDSSL
jgi:hypothetical protein